jgi:hypothetical protein
MQHTGVGAGCWVWVNPLDHNTFCCCGAVLAVLLVDTALLPHLEDMLAGQSMPPRNAFKLSTIS